MAARAIAGEYRRAFRGVSFHAGDTLIPSQDFRAIIRVMEERPGQLFDLRPVVLEQALLLGQRNFTGGQYSLLHRAKQIEDPLIATQQNANHLRAQRWGLARPLS